MRLHQEKWLLATIVAFPLQVYAQDMDFSADNTRILSDPTYLPLAGQFYGDSQYNYSDAHRNIFNALDNQTFRVNATSNALDQYVAFGITDELSVHGNIGYDWTATGRIDSLGNSTSLDRSGFSDPGFGATYRLLDQAFFPVDLDLSGTYRPDVFSDRSASDAGDGSIARGGQSGDFSVKLGREMHFFTIQGGFTATDYGARSLEDSTGTVSSKQSSYWAYALDLATQTRLTDQFAINAGVTETFPENSRIFNYATAISNISEPGNATNINVGLRYNIIPNQLVAGVDYNHIMRNTNFQDNPVPALDTLARNQHEDVFGASRQYAFP